MHDSLHKPFNKFWSFKSRLQTFKYQCFTQQFYILRLNSINVKYNKFKSNE